MEFLQTHYVGLGLTAASSHRGDIEKLANLGNMADEYLAPIQKLVPTHFTGEFEAICVYSTNGYNIHPFVGMCVVMTPANEPTWGAYTLTGDGSANPQYQTLQQLLKAADSSEESVLEDLGHTGRVTACGQRQADNYGYAYLHKVVDYTFPAEVKGRIGLELGNGYRTYIAAYLLSPDIPAANMTVLFRSCMTFRYEARSINVRALGRM